MRRTSLVLAVLVVLALSPHCVMASQSTPSENVALAKQRLIVLSDIEADPDDTESFVRLMLYSNEIDLEGLIATTSVWQQHVVHPESIRAVINEYGKVRSNLLLHAPGYPTAEHLDSLVVQGQPDYGMSSVGAGKNSRGSDLIVKALSSADPRPLWISVWGGANTLAQALTQIRDTNSATDAAKMIAKLRVYTISDQDDSGSWIRRNFPDLFYIVSTGRYADATWTAIHAKIEGIDNTTVSNAWLAANIQQGHGPLGAKYPDVAWGMEGDTPSFLGLIPNGLNVPDSPNFGGWGGRYEFYTPVVTGAGTATVEGGVPVETETRPIWTNAVDSFTPFVANDYGRAIKPGATTFRDFRVTLWRWRDDLQNDFAARMNWTTLPYAKANHPPVVKLTQSDRLTVRSNETFELNAAGSSDPDGDSLSFLWFSYAEAGSWKTPIPVSG
ncbi:MAG TPA: DUF1593 domain-containing protein, partial [Steroidobacteraceae bacterium]|nr:DUF1593 domain-containing protein [Steroidobacteraceae bacterium]